MAADASSRRFAAAMLVNAIRTLSPLFNTRRSPAQYFEAVEALIWIQSPSSDPFFDTLGWDPDVFRPKIDLPLFSDLALAVWKQNRAFMLRMHIATARYILNDRDEKIPYPKLVIFAEDSLRTTEVILREHATKGGSSVEAPEKFLEILEKLESIQ